MALMFALAVGIAFGFTLERAGLGTAPKLAGQFYLADFTVMKVMFTAIVVAMTGAFWLARLGVIDLEGLAVPETFLLPQLAGGAIFGAGFLIAGLCPGTSCVAAASGRGDGLAVMAGMFAGILGAGLAFSPFFAATAFGAWTVPQLLHVPYAVVAGAIVLAFAVAVRKPILIAVALVTALGGSPYRTHTVEPRELAAWIVEKKPGLQIVDARTAAEFALVRIPRSENRPGDGAITVRTAGRDYVLRGGIEAWTNEVVKTQHPTPTTIYFAPLRRHGC
jgi:uncharacterized membrane protein YedE/YeeE/rhodanese-related sulfurtransferase